MANDFRGTTNALTESRKEIDHNFSRAHRIVTSSILPIVERYREHSNSVWEGSKVWRAGHARTLPPPTGLRALANRIDRFTSSGNNSSRLLPMSRYLDMRNLTQKARRRKARRFLPPYQPAPRQAPPPRPMLLLLKYKTTKKSPRHRVMVHSIR